MPHVSFERAASRRPALYLLLPAAALWLGGCSSLTEFAQGDRVDYQSARPAESLAVPPDLAQLRRDPRFQVPDGPVSAAGLQAQMGATPGMGAQPAVVAPSTVGSVRLERGSGERWLLTTRPPEEVMPLVRQFWLDQGFALTTDSADLGLIETDWAENRAKLPQDIIRRTLGRLIDSAYSTGELDRFRTRLERTPAGTEIRVTHRGMVEVYSGPQQETTVWQPRPADPELEAEFLARLMVKLGATEEAARAQQASAPDRPRARVVQEGAAPVLVVEEDFDRTWRRVGLALDRTGFTVEDRDRAQGHFDVRYVPPQPPGARGNPGFFGRLFGRSGSEGPRPEQYRIAVRGQGERTTVAVQNRDGSPAPAQAAQRIVSLLASDLR